MNTKFVSWHLRGAAVVLAISSSLMLVEAARQPIPYDYSAVVAGGSGPVIDYGSSPQIQVQQSKSSKDNCDCGYVLVEKVVHVCRPQKSLVKVLKRKGTCTVNDKPIEVQKLEYPGVQPPPQPQQPQQPSCSAVASNSVPYGPGSYDMVSGEDDV